MIISLLHFEFLIFQRNWRGEEDCEIVGRLIGIISLQLREIGVQQQIVSYRDI